MAPGYSTHSRRQLFHGFATYLMLSLNVVLLFAGAKQCARFSTHPLAAAQLHTNGRRAGRYDGCPNECGPAYYNLGDGGEH